jgi:hypothetical protein
MSHVAGIEIPGMYHLVEQRLCRGRPAEMGFHDRHLSLAAIHGSIYRHGIQLCAYNMLSDRVLLALIPSRPRAIRLALLNADHAFVRRFDHIHREVLSLRPRPFHCCPFADEVAWSVMRYVDIASVPSGHANPLDPHALSSASEHAGLLRHGLLTAPPERLPHPAAWRAFIDSSGDARFVEALELCLRTGMPFGPYPFVHKVEQACGRRLHPACLRWPGLFDGRR